MVDLVESRAYLERAFKLFVAQGDKVGTLMAWSSVVDALILERNDYTRLDYWMDWMEAHIENNGSFPSPEIEAEVATAMAGAYTWHLTSHPECKRWVERSLELTRGVTHIGIQMKAFSYALMYFGVMSQFTRCIDLINEVRRLVPATDAPPLLSIVIKCYEAVGYSFSYEHYEKAFRSVVEGLNLAEKTGVHILDNYLYSTGFYVYLCMGNMDKARKCLEKLRVTVRNDQLTNAAQYYDLAAWLHLLDGNFSRARDHAEQSVSLNAASGAAFPEFLSRYVAALSLHKVGEFEKADDMLSRASEIVQRANSPFDIYLCLLAEAEFAFDRGNESECYEALRRALKIGRENDYITTFFLWRTSVLSRLLDKALKADIETDYVKRFIKKCNLLPDAKSLDSEHWPRPIRVYTLGRFSILRDEKPMKFTGKVQQRPLSMLKAVIALVGRDVHEDRLIDALWPEAEGDAAHISLRTTVHRLRRLLGNDNALQYSEGRIGLDPRYCWIDAWSFLRISGDAEYLWKRSHSGKGADNDHISDAIGVSERAVNLYKGDFLSGDSKYSWAFSMRERLKNRYTRLIGRLGECHEHMRQWEKAIECYQQALEADSLQEEFYRKLQICYQKSGRRSQALAVFKRCCDELSLAIGIEPSRETIRIYEALRSDGQ